MHSTRAMFVGVPPPQYSLQTLWGKHTCLSGALGGLLNPKTPRGCAPFSPAF